jgi:hypothetical protein
LPRERLLETDDADPEASPAERLGLVPAVREPIQFRVGTLAASRRAAPATQISLQEIDNAVSRSTVRRRGRREMNVPEATAGAAPERPARFVASRSTPEPALALACVASPRLRHVLEGVCAWSEVHRSHGSASLHVPPGFPAGDHALEILADGRRRGVAILRLARQHLPITASRPGLHRPCSDAGGRRDLMRWSSRRVSGA